MDFKRVQFLKMQMTARVGRKTEPLTEQEVFSMDALTLAYIGDACWSFYVRKVLIDTQIYSVQILHTLAADIVSAKRQSQMLYGIRDLMSERELKLCRRARNTHSTVPKSATVEEYREATAFEAFIGYLYLSGQKDRMDFMQKRALHVLTEEFAHEK